MYSRDTRTATLARGDRRCERVFTIADHENIAIFNTMPRTHNQLSFRDYRMRTGWGGPRPGAGRKPSTSRPPVHHVERQPVPRNVPAHVTLRLLRGIPSLRSRRFLSAFRASLRQACDRGDFRVVHYSVQRNHVHMLIEAAGKNAMGRGMKSIAARLARAANRVFGRSGAVLHGRYHIRLLRTPREVRHALAYVLLNARKHWKERTGAPPPVRMDEAASGRWFDGWKPGTLGFLSSREPREVARARTWLLRVGWRRRGLIDPAEVPGS